MSIKIVAKAFVLLWMLRMLTCSLAGQGTAPESFEETAEQRIERLKSELLHAEAALVGASVVEAAGVANVAKAEIPVGALIIVKTEGGGGSGFIAELKGRTFFVTNIHVLAAAREASFQTVNGRELHLPDLVFLSEQRDLAIVPILWTGDSLQVSASLSLDQVAIGDAITVMGNSDGVGVVTRLEGAIDGLGPREIEISAKFVAGNSGSPILHDALGTVIGVVSHMRDLSDKDKWTADSELADIRRFGFRLDGEISWQRLTLKELFQQGELYARFEERTQILARTIYMLKHERTIMTGYSSHESLGYLFEHLDGFSWKRGTGSANNIMKLERFMNNLQSELITDRQNTEKALTVNFFKERFYRADSLRDYFSQELRQVSF
jgi:hypothetical protein